MTFDDWISEQADAIRNLKGQTVRKFIATEMAFREADGDNPHQFTDPALPFLQVCPLYMILATGRIVEFTTCENDDTGCTWGMYRNPDPRQSEPELDAASNDSIFRTRELGTFPTGEISAVGVALDSWGDIAEVTLDFSGDTILLVSGEVYENTNGTFDIIEGDESILLFRDPKQKDKVKFSDTVT